MKQLMQRIPFSKSLPVGERTYKISVAIDSHLCTGCGICAIECPSRIIEMIPSVLNSCNEKANCSKSCLCQNEVSVALNQLEKGGNIEEVWKTITAVNPFPSVLGRLCPHPCEDACNRSRLDQPVNLHEAERYIGDVAIANAFEFVKPDFINKEKIAVIGGGLSGLTCAYHLAKNGYQVTVFDENEKMGGTVQNVIPNFRIPRSILNAEIERIEKMGVEFRNNIKIGLDYTIDQLREDYDALYMSIGCHHDADLNVNGEEYAQSLFEFLGEAVSENPKPLVGTVVIVGGGNSAMDAARTALRRGATRVAVICLESRYAMKASEVEVAEALSEGIVLMNELAIERIEKKNDEKKYIYFKKCISIYDENGRFNPEYEVIDGEYISADIIVKAIGLYPEADLLINEGLKTSSSGHLLLGSFETMQTEVTGIFAGGDIVKHPDSGTIGGGIQMARIAAENIVRFLSGQLTKDSSDNKLSIERSQPQYNTVIKRQNGKEKRFNKAAVIWDEDYVTDLTKEQIKIEAERCLACREKQAIYIGEQDSTYFNRACHNCHNCVSVCPENAISFQYATISK